MVVLIGEMYAPREINIQLTDAQLPAAIEASYEALIKRVRWSVTREEHWANLGFDVAQQSVRLLADVYTVLMFAARDLPAEAFHERFFELFGIGPEMWNLINSVTYGKSWDNVPIHPHMPFDPNRPACGLCEIFEVV